MRAFLEGPGLPFALAEVAGGHGDLLDLSVGARAERRVEGAIVMPCREPQQSTASGQLADPVDPGRSVGVGEPARRAVRSFPTPPPRSPACRPGGARSGARRRRAAVHARRRPRETRPGCGHHHPAGSTDAGLGRGRRQPGSFQDRPGETPEFTQPDCALGFAVASTIARMEPGNVQDGMLHPPASK